MPDTRAQDLVDAARAARLTEMAARTGQGYPAYVPPSPAKAESGGRNRGIPCLSPALRNERMPKDFKGPRKVKP